MKLQIQMKDIVRLIDGFCERDMFCLKDSFYYLEKDSDLNRGKGT